MQYLYEQGDLLNSPYEVFLFDTSKHGFPVRQHWHYYAEMLYILEGDVICSCGDQTFNMKPGDVIFFPPKSLHSIYSNGNHLIKYYVVKFDLGRFQEHADITLKLRTIILEAGQISTAPIYFPKEVNEAYPFLFLFEALAHEYARKDYAYHAAMKSTINCILIAIIRIWRSNGFNPSEQVSQPEDSAIDTITQYIDAHSNQQILVEDLAAKCNMSYSFFAKKFKQIYGRSCKEYIEYIRVSKAEDLLLFTDNDLTYISQETGFSDSSHMIKTFKKYKGITPKQYRLMSTKSVNEKKI